MSPLEVAKAALPLPQLMERLGLGQHAKRSARCCFHDDHSNSFSVFEGPDGAWRWNCFAGCTPNGKPGDAADFIAKLENITVGDACRRLIELAGIAKASGCSQPRSLGRARPHKIEERPPRIPCMPDSVAAAWREGVEYLQARAVISARLAASRGWPVEFAQHLILCGGVALPLHNGRRDVAFQVIAPEGERGAMTTRPVGYHVRVPGKSGEKLSWRYRPTERHDGHGIPSLPYFLGDFEKAKLLIIAEGQWDILTFCLAAGWIGDRGLWPEAVGVVGIRGASGTEAFLRHYRPYWPTGVECLVLPDGDPPGEKWYKHERSFASELLKLCRKVAVVTCEPHKDLNDMYRAEKPTPDAIRDLLAAHGMMSAESEVIA